MLYVCELYKRLVSTLSRHYILKRLTVKLFILFYLARTNFQNQISECLPRSTTLYG